MLENSSTLVEYLPRLSDSTHFPLLLKLLQNLNYSCSSYIQQIIRWLFLLMSLLLPKTLNPQILLKFFNKMLVTYFPLVLYCFRLYTLQCLYHLLLVGIQVFSNFLRMLENDLLKFEDSLRHLLLFELFYFLLIRQ